MLAISEDEVAVMHIAVATLREALRPFANKWAVGQHASNKEYRAAAVAMESTSGEATESDTLPQWKVAAIMEASGCPADANMGDYLRGLKAKAEDHRVLQEVLIELSLDLANEKHAASKQAGEDEG